MSSVRSLSVVAGAVALSAATSLAAPIAPPTWVQSSADPLAAATAQARTYQQWDVFTSTSGPNAPAPTNFTWNSVSYASDLNPSTTAANAFDTAAPGNGAFLTSGGNIYSPTGTSAPRAIVPLPAVDGFAEAVTVQINVLGTGIDTTTFKANGLTASTLGGYSLASVPVGAGMGASTFYTLSFLLPDTNTLTLDFTALGSSSSLDVLAIETRSTVPEPASLALLGVAAAGLLARRRR